MVKVETVPEAVGGAVPLAAPGLEPDMAGAQDTIYLCNFRVSVDGEWLCLKELQDVEFSVPDTAGASPPDSPSPDGNLPLLARDPVMIERSNLLHISKLIVKELIETSLKYGRMLDSDHMPLQHFFIVLEHVLRHGLKPKKGLLGPKKELWDILQSVEKYTTEAADITASVRDLPTVRTHMGRARAWLRLALMQKKLADYLKILIDHKEDLLSEYFEPDALMMSDEAVVIMGLLVGLNVIDCNLCVKEEDLDCQQGVIDFSLYLRSTNHSTANSPEDELDQDNMTTVLDQKNYIEELNRHLNATVTNLQTKVEALTTTNALMKEDLAIAKNQILSLQEENRSMKVRELPPEEPAAASAGSGAPPDEGGGSGRGSPSKDLEELRAQLEQEKKARQEAEKELDLQISLKAEMEVAMKLLEKDIHEKQDTIVSLRRQLDDIKLINLEMYKKLQECKQELTEKGEMVTRLQAKTSQIGQILNNLEKFNHMVKDTDGGGNGGNVLKTIPRYDTSYRSKGIDSRGREPIQCHGKHSNKSSSSQAQSHKGLNQNKVQNQARAQSQNKNQDQSQNKNIEPSQNKNQDQSQNENLAQSSQNPNQTQNQVKGPNQSLGQNQNDSQTQGPSSSPVQIQNEGQNQCNAQSQVLEAPPSSQNNKK